MIKLLFFLNIFILISFDFVYSQNIINNKIVLPYDNNFFQTEPVSKKNNLKFPSFYLHAGAGLMNGGRLGLISNINKILSLEASYGSDIRNFYGSSHSETRYGGGINLYHPDIDILLSLSFVYAKSPQKNIKENPRYFYGLNFGYLGRQPGVNFLIRGGLYLAYYNYSAQNIIQYDAIYPNIDIGLGWTF